MSVSILSAKKYARGRPRVDSEAVNVRLERPALTRLDAWIAAQPEPQPSRPEAIRRLVEKSLAGESEAPVRPSDAALDRQIAKAEAVIAEILKPAGPSPEAGMATMDKAMAENELAKLKNNRTRRKGAGRK